MKITLHSLSIALALLALSTLNLQLSTLHAQGTAFTYQGRLNDNGTPANGSYDFQFKLYNNPAAKIPVGGSLQTNAIPVTNGLFMLALDFGPSVFTGTNYWLEVDVRTNGAGIFTPLSPVQAVTPAPYAVFANTASNLLGPIPLAELPPGIVTNNASSITFGSSVTTPAIYAANNSSFLLQGSGGSGAGSGGDVNVASGLGGTTGSGGNINITSGASGSVSSGSGGNVNISAGTGGNGGTVNLTGGASGGGLLSGGNVAIAGGYGGTSGNGGVISLLGGNGSVGGSVNLSGGISPGGGSGGSISILSGANSSLNSVSNSYSRVNIQGIGLNPGDGGLITVEGGHNLAYGSTCSAGGNIAVTAGGGGTCANGGTISINGGSGSAGGNVNLSGGASASNGTGGNVSILSGGNISVNSTSNSFSTVVIQGIGLNPGDGGGITLEGGHNTAYGSPSSSGGNLRISGGNGTGGYSGGNIVLLPGTPGGYVGIGKSNPIVTLDVAGTIGADGNFILPPTGPNAGIIYSGPVTLLHTYGAANFFAGGNAGNVTMSGTNDTGMGYVALQHNTTGNYNTASGAWALAQNRTGSENTASGYQTLFSNTNGFDNTAVGCSVLANLTVGSNNIAMGANAGGNLTNGSYNIYIGNPGVPGDNGIIRIGTSNLQTATYLIGTVYANGVALTSDRNTKENFTPVNAREVLGKVAALPVTEWNYKTDHKGVQHIGPMAQDFQSAFHLAGNDDRHIAVVDEGGVALAAIQGLNQKLEEKDAEIQKLEKKLDELTTVVKQLAAQK